MIDYALSVIKKIIVGVDGHPLKGDSCGKFCEKSSSDIVFRKHNRNVSRKLEGPKYV